MVAATGKHFKSNSGLVYVWVTLVDVYIWELRSFEA